MDRLQSTTISDIDGLHGVESSQMRGRGKAARATVDQVLDPRTMRMVEKLQKQGHLDNLSGCISTGKEANIYHSTDSQGRDVAVKIYKTSILIFKDRQRYFVGEFRFRHGVSRNNPRKMVKLWAEKEMRNLKRLRAAGIPSPDALALKHHVLVLEFLDDGSGAAAPRLKDADLDSSMLERLYDEILCIIRRMYHQCNLVHADLSEYNILYYQDHAAIIDVSQSVEQNHPHSLEFLRNDIHIMNNFFQKRGIRTLSLRRVYDFVKNEISGNTDEEMLETIVKLKNTEFIIECRTEDRRIEDDKVFLRSFIPQNLNQVIDAERDTLRLLEGEGHDLIYKELIPESVRIQQSNESADDALFEDFVKDLKAVNDVVRASEEFSSEDSSSSEDDSMVQDIPLAAPRLKRTEDRESKRLRKLAVKEMKRVSNRKGIS